MPGLSELGRALQDKNIDVVESLLADDVLFRSPVAFKPYPGKAITNAILRSVVDVFEGFRYVRELHDGHQHALIFEASVNDLAVTGCDFLVYDEEGKIVDFMVMVRPLSAAKALAERMEERYRGIQAAARAWSEAR